MVSKRELLDLYTDHDIRIFDLEMQLKRLEKKLVKASPEKKEKKAKKK